MRNDIIAKRISFLMSNMSFFYNTADEDFQKRFTKFLNKTITSSIKTFKKKVYDKKIFCCKSNNFSIPQFQKFIRKI